MDIQTSGQEARVYELGCYACKVCMPMNGMPCSLEIHF